MLKKHIAGCLVATAFIAAPAMAQTSPTSPTQSSPMPSSQTQAPSSTMSGQFMTKIEMGQVMASDLIGTKVVGANNESIGEVNDVIMDRDGKAVAAIIGVGGFLGVGERDVAVPFNSLEFATRDQARALDGKNPTTTGSTTTGATTASPSAPSASGSMSTADTSQPERVILRMTKEQLQTAPAFDKKG